MLSMDRDPLLAALSRRQPEHGPKQHIRDRVDDQRAVREGAVQVDGRGDDRDLGQRDRDQGSHPEVQ
jgi:hypothetical protein